MIECLSIHINFVLIVLSNRTMRYPLLASIILCMHCLNCRYRYTVPFRWKKSILVRSHWVLDYSAFVQMKHTKSVYFLTEHLLKRKLTRRFPSLRLLSPKLWHFKSFAICLKKGRSNLAYSLSVKVKLFFFFLAFFKQTYCKWFFVLLLLDDTRFVTSRIPVFTLASLQ